MKKNNALIGLLLAVVICGLIIFSIENDYSFTQIIVGFLVFILPSIFITSLQSKTIMFLITSITIMLGYISYKYEFYYIWIGVLQAVIIGRAINYFKIKTIT